MIDRPATGVPRQSARSVATAGVSEARERSRLVVALSSRCHRELLPPGDRDVAVV